MLAMMALGALLAVGSAGPVLAMVALMLPPDSKSFGLSVFHCGVSVIDPTASVVLGIVLQARARARAHRGARHDAPCCPHSMVASKVGMLVPALNDRLRWPGCNMILTALGMQCQVELCFLRCACLYTLTQHCRVPAFNSRGTQQLYMCIPLHMARATSTRAGMVQRRSPLVIGRWRRRRAGRSERRSDAGAPPRAGPAAARGGEGDRRGGGRARPRRAGARAGHRARADRHRQSFACGVSSALYAAAVRGVRPDFRLCASPDAGGAPPGDALSGGEGGSAAGRKARAGPSRRRLAGFVVGVLVLGAGVAGILALSLIACYAPQKFGPGTPPVVESTGAVT